MPQTKRRNTWQQEAVRAALGGTDAFVSAQDLHQRMLESGERVGVATVYRALSRLADDHQVDVRVDDEGQQLFRACSTNTHHHHLICRSCGATVEIQAAPIERWAAEVAAANGYSQPSHVVDVYGLCPRCSSRIGAERGLR